MKNEGFPKEAVLIVGSDKTAFSLVVCLLHAGHPVRLYTSKPKQADKSIRTHLNDSIQFQSAYPTVSAEYEILSRLGDRPRERLAIILSAENLSDKKAALARLEKKLSTDTLIAINMESISLQEIQQEAIHKERIIGANWTDPVHTTFFLEIITNELTPQHLKDRFYGLAKHHWKKDPYILKHGRGIRSKMMCAMIREAFHLIEKGYVTPEDVDRACRNDPGYYFPFAGNFRYMDLMGAYIYGVVMKDLNPNLSKSSSIPDFFYELITKGHLGMESGKGFFDYEKNEVANWEILFCKFSYQIQEVIDKYPFKYLEVEKEVKNRP